MKIILTILCLIGFAQSTHATDPPDNGAPTVALGDTDSDGDGVSDAVDNCTFVPNPDQRDTDGDCFGNICDADLNNDGIVNGVAVNVVNAIDLGLFRLSYFTTGPHADFDGDGVVNARDLGILRLLFFMPPGPGACP